MSRNAELSETAAQTGQIKFAWLEITGLCQLECSHCYANSGPTGDHGVMRPEDWQRVIGELGNMGAEGVQFIGGEPILHPDLPDLLDSATGVDLKTEVYSNLVAVPERVWDGLVRNKTVLATSYYSPDPKQHQEITGRPTLRQTENNIRRAVALGVPVRAEIIDVLPGQQIKAAIAKLDELGVSHKPRVDRVRRIGRGAVSPNVELDMNQLCGGCTSGTIMIGPTGDVTRCIFTRQVSVGNVRDNPLPDIVAGKGFRRFTNELDAHFNSRKDEICAPHACNPHCNPMSKCIPWQSCSPRTKSDEMLSLEPQKSA